MVSEVEMVGKCLFDEMEIMKINTNHATSVLDTRMTRIETVLSSLCVSHMTERLDAQKYMNKMWWRTFWSLY